MRLISETLVQMYCWERKETAQTLAEYALVLALVSIAALPVMILMGLPIRAVFSDVADFLRAA